MPPTLEDWLRKYTAKGAYPAVWFLPVKCGCGCDRFRLARAHGNVRRTCAACGVERHISRSGDSANWDEAVEYDGAEVEEFACYECGSKEAEVCMGFADYARHPGYKKSTEPLPDSILWFFVGIRCSGCWLEGCYGDGKVGRGPANEALMRVVSGEPTGEKAG